MKTEAQGRVILRYDLELGTIAPTNIAVGPNSKLLHVGCKPKPAVWIEHEVSSQQKEDIMTDRFWEFLVLGSGKVFPLEMWEFAGTCMSMYFYPSKKGVRQETLVWHVYRREVLNGDSCP